MLSVIRQVENRIKKQFVYDGIEFFQLCSEEEKYIGTYKNFKTITLKIKEPSK